MVKFALASELVETATEAEATDDYAHCQQQSSTSMHLPNATNSTTQNALSKLNSSGRQVHLASCMDTVSLDDDEKNTDTHGRFQESHHLHPGHLFDMSEVTSEYNLLHDAPCGSHLDKAVVYSSGDTATSLSDLLLPISSVSVLTNSMQHDSSDSGRKARDSYQQNLMDPMSQAAAVNDAFHPSPTFSIDNVSRYCTAADDPVSTYTTENRLHELLKARYDPGMLRAWDYVEGYARLKIHLEKNVSCGSRFRILRQLEHLRPRFSEAMQSFTDMQLVVAEKWFELSLMELNRIFAPMIIPACCWRRTGEIFLGSRHMADLLNVSPDDLRGGKLAIHEIMSEDDLVSYWERFSTIALNYSQKATSTSCILKRSRREIDANGIPALKFQGDKGMTCCFSFTVRRDPCNIPSLIVGKFLPI